MNDRLRRLTWVLAGLFLVLVGQLSYLQIIAANELVANENNGRTLAEERRFRRGAIFSREGSVLAESHPVDGGFERTYPRGELFAPITGFSSFRYGRSGIEDSANEYLMVKRRAESLREYINQLAGGERVGDDIFLSVSEGIQRAAADALGERRGAVVALDPSTGDVLAMVSYPSYDPNDVDEDFQLLRTVRSSPLVNRAAQGLYPPGSTFKVITASAALEKGVASPTSVYDGPSELYVSGGKVVNFDNQELGKMTLKEAFAHSVNTAFAGVGLDVGYDLIDYARRFGFGEKPPIALPATASRIRSSSDMDELALAWTAVGQAELEATPLEMALVAAGIANGGKVMAPRLIREVRSPEGILQRSFPPEIWRQAVSERTAREVTDLMVEAVERGTGKAARIPGVEVAGKTGTAETEGGEPHAWFIGFAPARNPKVAVAVVVEHGGLGGRVAAPIAKKVIEAVLGD